MLKLRFYGVVGVLAGAAWTAMHSAFVQGFLGGTAADNVLFFYGVLTASAIWAAYFCFAPSVFDWFEVKSFGPFREMFRRWGLFLGATALGANTAFAAIPFKDPAMQALVESARVQHLWLVVEVLLAAALIVNVHRLAAASQRPS